MTIVRQLTATATALQTSFGLAMLQLLRTPFAMSSSESYRRVTALMGQ